MGYRDETETLRRRVAELEGELGDARETIGRLTGLERAPASGNTEKSSALLGAPKWVGLERELDLEVSDAGLEAIAELLRERLGGATVSQVGRTLTAPGFSLTQRDGMTQISMTGDYQGVPLASVVGGVLAGGFLTLATFGVIHDFIVRIAESNALWMAPIFMVMCFGLLRGRLARSVRKRATDLRGTFEGVVELAKRHRVREAPQARVEITSDEATEEVEVLASEENEREGIEE